MSHCFKRIIGINSMRHTKAKTQNKRIKTSLEYRALNTTNETYMIPETDLTISSFILKIF